MRPDRRGRVNDSPCPHMCRQESKNPSKAEIGGKSRFRSEQRIDMPKILLRTLGCRLNQAESFEIEEGLLASGFELAEPNDTPDVVIVNTCTVTSDSTRSSRRLISRSAREYPNARLIVTGCYAVAAPEEVRAVDGVDDVIPNKGKDSIVGFLQNQYFPRTLQLSSCMPQVPPRVILKVQSGCDEMCTFCIVPYTRGDLDSRDIEHVVSAGVSLAERGAVELTLSGVHLGRYGIDSGTGVGLYELVCRLLESLPSSLRIRLSSIELTSIDERLVELIACEPRLCRHLHIPLQSGDDGVLDAMGRPYDSKRYLEVVSAIKEKIPGVALTTDVMVGFPGETLVAFGNTLDIVERVAFAKVHVFRYSPREGTPAASREDQVPEDEKRARSKTLRELGDKLRLEFHQLQAKAGLIEGVLIEGHGPAESGCISDSSGAATQRVAPSLFGITDNYVKIETSGPVGTVGKYVKVKPVDVSVERVSAELLLDQGVDPLPKRPYQSGTVLRR